MLDPLENCQEKLKHGKSKVKKEIGMSGKKQKKNWIKCLV